MTAMVPTITIYKSHASPKTWIRGGRQRLPRYIEAIRSIAELPVWDQKSDEVPSVVIRVKDLDLKFAQTIQSYLAHNKLNGRNKTIKTKYRTIVKGKEAEFVRIM